MRPDPARRAWVLGVLNTATQLHIDIKFDGTSVQARRRVGSGNRCVGEHPADTKSPKLCPPRARVGGTCSLHDQSRRAEPLLNNSVLPQSSGSQDLDLFARDQEVDDLPNWSMARYR